MPLKRLPASIKVILRQLASTFLASVILAASALGQASEGHKIADTDISLTKCWEGSVEDGGATSLALDGGQVFVIHAGGTLDSLSQDGKMLWSAELGGEIVSNLVGSSDQVFVVTSAAGETAKGTLRSLSRATGIGRWSTPFDAGANHFLGLSSTQITAVSSGGLITAFDITTGRVLWSTRTVALTGVPAFGSRQIVAPAEDGRIFSIESSGGAIKQLRRLPATAGALMLEHDNALVTGDRLGTVTYFREQPKPVWKYRTGGAISGMMSFGERVLAASDDNFLYMISAHNGHVVWRRRLSGRAAILSQLGPTMIFVSAPDEHGGVVIETTKGRPVGRILLPEDATPVAVQAASGGELIILTAGSLIGYSLSACQKI